MNYNMREYKKISEQKQHCGLLRRGTATWLLACIVCVFAFVAPWTVYGLSNEILTADERRFLDSHGPIIFVSQSQYPPFEAVQEDGSMDGMCIELVRWMATEFGVKVEFRYMSFQEAQQAVLDGKADVLTSLFYSDKRAERFAFSEPIFDVPASIFVKADRPDISHLKDLDGKRIAIQRGDYAKEFLESKGIRFDVVPTDNFAQATDAVIDGRADALIGDEQIVLYHLYSNKLTEQAKKVGVPLYIGKNCLAMKRGNVPLTGIIAKWVAHAETHKVPEGISVKWLGVRQSTLDKGLAQYAPHLVIGVVSLLAVIGVIAAINRKLRLIVREKTREQGAILDASQAGIAYTKNRIIIWANPEMYAMFGYQPPEMTGLPTRELYPSHEEYEQMWSAYSQLTSSVPYKIEMQMRCKDGAIIWVQLQGRALDLTNPLAASVWTFQDITARKQAEEALVASNKLLERIFASTEVMIAYLDTNFNFIRVNRAYASTDGQEPEFFVGKNHFSIYPNAENEEIFRRVVATGIPYTTYAKPFEYSDHPERGVTYWDWTLQPILDEDDDKKVTGLTMTMQNVTEHHRSEAERDEALTLVKTVINAAPVRIFWKDRESRYLGCNPLFARDAGKTGPEELIGKDDSAMAWAGQAALYREGDRQVMETGTAKLNFEEPQTTADGKTIYLRTSKVPLRNRRGEIIGLLGLYDDITEQKLAMEKVHAQFSELRRWQEVMLNREERIINLKGEVNELLACLQEPPRYSITPGKGEDA